VVLISPPTGVSGRSMTVGCFSSGFLTSFSSFFSGVLVLSWVASLV